MHTTRLLRFAALLSALATTAAAQHTIRSMTGDQAGAGFGRSLSVVDDIDGDGLRDLVVGEPTRDLGSSTDVGAGVLLRTGAWTIRARSYGGLPFAQVGGSVAGLGDVNGDAVPDWAIGQLPTAIGNTAVRVLSGLTGMQLYEVTGDPLSQFGSSICSIGDRNGDGRADFAVGAPQNSPSRPNGSVRFLSGQNGAVLAILDGPSNSAFGRALATVGDLTGDGQPEIVVADPLENANGNDSGRVLAKNPRDGQVNSWLWSQTAAFPAGSQAGVAMAALGDITGDGKSEVLVATANGTVRILSGADGTHLRSITNSEFGPAPSVAGVGDWNGDGVLDFAVGAGTANVGSGRVFVYSTAAVANPLLTTLQGTAAAGFGTAVVGLGDLDGDGRHEIAVGAPTYLAGGSPMGRVTVHAYDIQPEAVPFGSGCAGLVGVPSLYFAGAPNLGDTFDIQCGNLRSNAFGYLVFGFSDTTTGLFPLPLSLQPLGLGAACTMWVSPDAPEPFATTGGSLLTRTMALPNIPSLATFTFFVQVSQFDAAAVGGISFSNAGRVRVGNL